MLVLAKAMLAMMIGFILAIVCGTFIVPFMKRVGAKQVVSWSLLQHKKKEGTPTMGSFIFIIPTLLTIFILLLTNRLEWSNNLLTN